MFNPVFINIACNKLICFCCALFHSSRPLHADPVTRIFALERIIPDGGVKYTSTALFAIT
jgi:hypothetical protein